MRFLGQNAGMPHWLDRISPRPNILWRGEWPAHFMEPARALYDHELVLVSKGKFHLRIGEAGYEMNEGSFALIPPATLHTSRASGTATFRSCIHFDWMGGKVPRRPICSYFPGKPANRLVVKAPPFVPSGPRIGRFDPGGSIPSLTETLFQYWRTSGSFYRSLCRGVLLELLVRLLWEKPSRRPPPPDHGSQLACAAKEQLDFHVDGDAGIQDLLSSLGRSYPHVARVFRKNFGLTPVDYLTARKMERAKTLLRNPRLGIAQVAYESGFHDPGYFARKFRQRIGLTPGQYRSGILRNSQ